LVVSASQDDRRMELRIRAGERAGRNRIVADAVSVALQRRWIAIA
jgi:hypothetical protein